MEGTKPMTTPMSATTPLLHSSDTPPPSPTEYRALVAYKTRCCLQHKQAIAKSMHTPIFDHWSALKWLLRYLTGTSDKGVHISTKSPHTFHAYADQPPVIYCDNLGVTHLSSNLVFHSQINHITLAYHFVREQVQNGIILSVVNPINVSTMCLMSPPMTSSHTSLLSLCFDLDLICSFPS
ncbi:hypothetical protein V2J09_000164 [Rumex salicifolius]